MPQIYSSDMALAARLTRGGKLAQATEVLQRVLSGRAQAPSHAGRGENSTTEPKPRRGGLGSMPLKGLGETLRDLAAARPHRFNLRQGTAVPEIILPDGATFEKVSFSNAAGARDYKLYVPSSAPAGRQRALIVMLHGCTQTPDDFAAGTRMNSLAEEYGSLVAYPEQPCSANPNNCWNWFSPADQRRGHGEPSIVAGITREIIRKHDIDPRRVYAAGLSAGAAAAVVLGSEYPDLYAAIGVHSGLPSGAAHDIPSAFAAMRSGGSGGGARLVPSIVFHGDNDPTVHPRNGDRVVAQSIGAAVDWVSTIERGQARNGRPYSRTVYATMSGSVVCEKWTIQGAGHAWAGGSAAGSYTDPQGPDASREMLRFFMQTERL